MLARNGKAPPSRSERLQASRARILHRVCPLSLRLQSSHLRAFTRATVDIARARAAPRETLARAARCAMQVRLESCISEVRVRRRRAHARPREGNKS